MIRGEHVRLLDGLEVPAQFSLPNPSRGLLAQQLPGRRVPRPRGVPAAPGAQRRSPVPLTVKAHEERVYRSINATGVIQFDNGATKKVYEKLPIE